MVSRVRTTCFLTFFVFIAIISAYVAGLLGFINILPRWTARSAEGSLYWY